MSRAACDVDNPLTGPHGAAYGPRKGASPEDVQPLEANLNHWAALVDFETHLQAELVVVGEGSLDEQTLRGKAPAGVAKAAQKRGATVIAMCGRTTLDDEQLRDAGITAAYSLADLEPDPAVSMT